MSEEKDAKKQAPKGGKLPLDLPEPILFNLFSSIPILELKRLPRYPISHRFLAAIREVLRRIALESLQKTLDLYKKKSAAGKEAYMGVSLCENKCCKMQTMQKLVN
jgi:hypothetical protein